jgi:hypothetical protein
MTLPDRERDILLGVGVGDGDICGEGDIGVGGGYNCLIRSNITNTLSCKIS